MSELEDGLAHALAVLAVTLAILFYLGWWRIPRVTIGDNETALIYRHGRFSRQVGPGRHFLFPGSVVRRCRTIPQTLHIRPPDMLTRDGIPVRVTALVTFRIAPADARGVLETDVLTPIERVRHTALFALSDLIEDRTMADLLEERGGLDAELTSNMREREVPLPPRIALLDVRVGPLTVGPDVRRMLIAAARDRANPDPTAGA